MMETHSLNYCLVWEAWKVAVFQTFGTSQLASKFVSEWELWGNAGVTVWRHVTRSRAFPYTCLWQDWQTTIDQRETYVRDRHNESEMPSEMCACSCGLAKWLIIYSQQAFWLQAVDYMGYSLLIFSCTVFDTIFFHFMIQYFAEEVLLLLTLSTQAFVS